MEDGPHLKSDTAAVNGHGSSSWTSLLGHKVSFTNRPDPPLTDVLLRLDLTKMTFKFRLGLETVCAPSYDKSQWWVPVCDVSPRSSGQANK